MDTPKRQRIRDRQHFKCLQCNGPYSTPHYRKHLSKYCSRRCTALATRVAYVTKCTICNKEFEHIASRCNKAKYCSTGCYNKAQIGRGLTEYECKHCGKKFQDSKSCKRKYCSKACVGKESKKTWKGKFTTVRKNMIARGLLEKCQLCGFDECKEILGVHHVDGNRNNNELSNLMVLCPNCHSMQHNKHIVH